MGKGSEISTRGLHALFIICLVATVLVGLIIPQTGHYVDRPTTTVEFRHLEPAPVHLSMQQQDTLEARKKTLLAKIDSLLGNIGNHRQSRLADNILQAAKELEELDEPVGYERIISFMLEKLDWDDRSHLHFFDAIAARAHYRADFTKVFYEALLRIPARRSVLYRACSMFKMRGDFYEPKLNRYQPHYTRELLGAVARINKALSEGVSVYDYTVKTCQESLREHLLDTDLRMAFLEQYQDSLNQREEEVLSEYLAVISPPDIDIPALMYQEFMGIQWHQPYEAWREAHPEAECKAFEAGPYSLSLDRIWAYRCMSPEEERFRKRYFFYPDSQAQTIRLQKIRLSFPVTDKEVVGPLSEKFDATLGEGEDRSEVHDLGAAAWSRIRSWDTQNFSMLLFRNSSRADWWNGLPQVEIIARSNELIRWSKAMEDIRWRRGQSNSDSLQADRLARTLAPYVPGIREKVHQLETHEAVLTLITNVMEFSPPDEEIRAAQLYQADELADQLMSIPYNAGQVEEWEQVLSEYGAAFPSNHYGHYYNHAFMRQLLDENLSGYWAEEAFLWGLKAGIFANPTEDPATFLQVIPHAEKHLEQHPGSHIRARVLLVLAQAHETGWNTGQVSPHDPYVELERFREDAPRHLKKAIHYYSLLLEEYPGHYFAGAAEIKLRWLKMGLSTNRKYYYYIND